MHITNDAILLTYVENEMVLGKFKFHAFKCNIACNKRKQGAAYAHKKYNRDATEFANRFYSRAAPELDYKRVLNFSE